jgi:ubiquinone biosynthesis protein UbiJ
MKNALLTFFQKAINRYLALDPESQHHMQKFQGKTIKIELQGLELEFLLHFTNAGIKIETDESIKPDTIIKGMPLSFLRMTLTRGDRKQFFSEDVSIQGDLELGQQVVDLFDQLEIDWEECLAQKIGDVPAHNLGRLMRGVKKWCDNSSTAFVQDLNDYLHEEKTWFPQREILQELFDEIDALRMDVDRLDVKVKQLLKASK